MPLNPSRVDVFFQITWAFRWRCKPIYLHKHVLSPFIAWIGIISYLSATGAASNLARALVVAIGVLGLTYYLLAMIFLNILMAEQTYRGC